jgi:NADPH:quinone reductase-like Zn-dependent oxidoreductase
MEYDLPAILGSDVAGEVEAVGPGVTRAAVGERVFGLERAPRVHNGTFAEHVVLPETSVAKTPSNVDDTHAGALGLAAVAALTAIDAARLEPGNRILINGAAGGIGCYATQLAAAGGARVLATARPGAEADLLHEFGAEITINWSTEDVADATAKTGGVHVLLDLVTFAPDALESLSRRVLAPGGRALTTLVPTGSAQMLMVMGSPELLDRIADHAARGELKVPLQTSFKLTEIEQAFAALRAGALGKIGLSGN